ncbi:hypothetical protein EW146_g7160 [Bondarzewia mesenterica]|uniref:Uncharacterized protein n=1 Tax=Bondarzewia mesenterica TaxID=1095465 RepID=A0A4S4LNF5_9AGAM|nr:hypothetical protein EW146_g7160 [Bondarzewia mesenterica]
MGVDVLNGAFGIDVLSIFTIALKPAATMSSGVQKTVMNHTSGDVTSATSATEQHTALSDVSNALTTSSTALSACTATSTNSTTSDAPKTPCAHALPHARTIELPAHRRTLRIKVQLLERKKVNKVIAHLPALPDGTVVAAGEGTAKPIHAMCLSYPEQEAEEKHFRRTSVASSTRRRSPKSRSSLFLFPSTTSLSACSWATTSNSTIKPKPTKSSKPTSQASSATSSITRNPDASSHRATLKLMPTTPHPACPYAPSDRAFSPPCSRSTTTPASYSDSESNDSETSDSDSEPPSSPLSDASSSHADDERARTSRSLFGIGHWPLTVKRGGWAVASIKSVWNWRF